MPAEQRYAFIIIALSFVGAFARMINENASTPARRNKVIRKFIKDGVCGTAIGLISLQLLSFWPAVGISIFSSVIGSDASIRIMKEKIENNKNSE